MIINSNYKKNDLSHFKINFKKTLNKCKRIRPESIILLVTDRHGTCFLQNEAALQQGKTVAANSDADLTWLGSLAMAEQKYARMIQVSLKL